MSLQHLSFIDLPEHVWSGGCDHVAVHRATGRVYVAHPCNDALDVIDGVTDRYLTAFDADRNKVYVFPPRTHRAAVYRDAGD